ncbi:MAG: hypothetical protein JW909_13820 [Planctomycetes bacterium]|nr:hypothetical protein [Planctomycetota bacterium]
MDGLLPTVNWCGHEITRLCVGHNPQKGTSHVGRELDAEMSEWYDPAKGKDLELLDLCERHGINTAQFGGELMHSLLHRYKEQGGRLQWIATLYDQDGEDFEEELKTILAVDPKPIGIQYYAGAGDRNYFQGRWEESRDRVKRVRDTGLMTGVGSHLSQVIAKIEDEGWDVDFYQTCFYTVYAKEQENRVDRDNETFDDEDRDRMTAVIKGVSKPCLAFKVLGSSRKCGSIAEVEEAFRYAYSNIKETDVVLVGMWQKYGDQVGQNTSLVRKIIGG